MFLMFLFIFLFCFEPTLRASETPKERLYKTILNAKSAYLDNTQSKWIYNPSLEQIKTVMRSEIARLENLGFRKVDEENEVPETVIDELEPCIVAYNTVSRAIKTRKAAKDVITLGMLHAYYRAVNNTLKNNADAGNKLMELNSFINYAFATNISRCGPAVEKRVAEGSTIDHAQEVYPATANNSDTRVKVNDYVWVPKKKLEYNQQQIYEVKNIFGDKGIKTTRSPYQEETIDDSLIQKIYPLDSLVPASSQPGLVNYSLHNKTIPLDCTALAQGQPAYPGTQYYLQQKQNNSTSCNLLVFNALTATEITCPLPLSLVVKAEDKPLIDGSAHYAAIAHNGQCNCLDIFQLPRTAQKATITIPPRSQEPYCDVQKQKKIAKPVALKRSAHPFTAVGLGQLTPVIAYAHYDPQNKQSKVSIEMLPRTEYAIKEKVPGRFEIFCDNLWCLIGYASSSTKKTVERSNYWDKEDTVRKSLYYCSIPTNSPIKKIVQADYRKFMCLTESGNLYRIEFDKTNNGRLKHVQFTESYEDIMIDYKNNNEICLKKKLI